MKTPFDELELCLQRRLGLEGSSCILGQRDWRLCRWPRGPEPEWQHHHELQHWYGHRRWFSRWLSGWELAIEPPRML